LLSLRAQEVPFFAFDQACLELETTAADEEEEEASKGGMDRAGMDMPIMHDGNSTSSSTTLAPTSASRTSCVATSTDSSLPSSTSSVVTR
jgi:hypothetical protein